MKKLSAIAALLFITASANSAFARDQISIVGSSTVYPFAITVAEKFGQNKGFKTPVIESTGSGGGLKMFCDGLGTTSPDVTNASRAIKQKEIDTCKKNGITPIEYLIGYDGITISNKKSGPNFVLTKEQLWRAVAAQVLIDGKWVENPYQKWSDIDPSLPDFKIDIMIPPTTSGTRDAFVELIMHSACKKMGMSKKEYKAYCTAVRTKGTFVVQMGENDNLIIQKLQDDDRRLGIFGFSFLDQNRDQVKASSIDGVLPEFDTIADGSYTVSRPLYFYVKKEHIGLVPGLQEYADFFMSDKFLGEEGVLYDQGLIAVQK